MMTAPSSVLLSIDICGYWHAGTGRAGGEDTDAIIDRDEAGLPLLRGRHIKGLLREAAERIGADWGIRDWSDAAVNILFGRRSREPSKGHPPQRSTPGCIRFGNARLPEAIIAKALEEKAAREKAGQNAASGIAGQFIARLASTRINPDTGAAMDKTLRSMEVAVPLKLSARLEWHAAGLDATSCWPDSGEEAERKALATVSQNWPTLIKECLPLVTAVGAYRNRGFGNARLSIPGEHHA